MIALRDATAADLPFLRQMLCTALFWNPEGERWPDEFALAHPQVRVFHENWGRAGDTALVAEDDGAPVGMVWYRFFTEAEHGEGFVDEATPELAIAVVDGHRGQGLGRTMLDAIAARARAGGVARISLSVEADNPARRLYARAGYEEYHFDDGNGRMILDLHR